MNITKLVSIIAIGVLVWFVQNPAIAKENLSRKCHRLYVKGVQQYGTLDYSGAERTLEKARKVCIYANSVPVETKISIAEELAFTKAALGKMAEAEEMFVILLQLEPTYELDEENQSPKLVEALNRARARAKTLLKQKQASKEEPSTKRPAKSQAAKHNKSQAKQSKIPTKKPKPQIKSAMKKKNHFETSAAVGGIMLFGKDISYFGGGISFSSTFSYSFLYHYFAGMSVLYNLHPTSALIPKQRLNLLSITTIGGFQIISQELRIRAGGELGSGFFGLDGIADRVGIYYGAFACLEFLLPQGFSMGMQITVSQLTDADAKNSTMAGMKLMFSYAW